MGRGEGWVERWMGVGGEWTGGGWEERWMVGEERGMRGEWGGGGCGRREGWEVNREEKGGCLNIE